MISRDIISVSYTHLDVYKRQAWSWARTSKLGLIAVSVIAVAGMIPVPLTVLAPAEVVGTSPALVVAPIDGVIRDVLVAPGTYVDAGTKLVTFVDTKLRNDMEIASRAKMIAEAKYFKVLQSSVANQKDCLLYTSRCV